MEDCWRPLETLRDRCRLCTTTGVVSRGPLEAIGDCWRPLGSARRTLKNRQEQQCFYCFCFCPHIRRGGKESKAKEKKKKKKSPKQKKDKSATTKSKTKGGDKETLRKKPACAEGTTEAMIKTPLKLVVRKLPPQVYLLDGNQKHLVMSSLSTQGRHYKEILKVIEHEITNGKITTKSHAVP
jgi:hypothetical protein